MQSKSLLTKMFAAASALRKQLLPWGPPTACQLSGELPEVSRASCNPGEAALPPRWLQKQKEVFPSPGSWLLSQGTSMLWLTQGRLDHLPKARTLRFNPFLTVTGFMTISCHPASSLGSGATRERLQPPRCGVGRALVTKWGSCCGNEPTRLLYLLDLLLPLLFWGPGQ